MVSALRFKGEKAPKKRKRTAAALDDDGNPLPSSSSLSTPSTSKSATKSARTAGADGEDEEEGWVDSEVLADINGPIILTFPSTTAICLACDAAGKVYASPISTSEENNLSTAEPTDIRQVWVVTKIYGTEKYSLKSHHGKYLGCDKFGILSATREAISPEEEFLPIRNELGGGRWAWQTVRDTFLSVDESGGKDASGETSIRGDAESVGFKETWVVRLQKKNKTRVKGGAGGGKEGKIRDKITRKELEEQAGVPLTDEQVKKLKKARREGGYNEALLDIRVKHGKHDKFAY